MQNSNPREDNKSPIENAQRNNILAARVISETVKTTLGPKGMDKMLVDRAGSVTVTNDGVTILSEMEIEHPAAKMIVDIAKTQESEVGDGTTTAVMLAGKLLENAEKLLNSKIHPTIITRGYQLANEAAQKILNEIAIEISSEEELLKVASTAMTGRASEHLKDKFSKLIVDAVKIVGEGKSVNLNDINLERKKGSSLEDTELIKGIVLDERRVSQEMPKKIIDTTIGLIEEALETRSLDAEAKISVTSPEQLQQFINQEDALLREKVEKIKESGIKVLFVQRGIDAAVSFYLARAGIYAAKRVSKYDMQNIAKATGAKIVSKLSELTPEDLGFAGIVEERCERDDALTYITECKNPKALTILIRGGTNHVMSEVERAMKDALGDICATLESSKIVAGGGAIEIEVSKRLREFASTTHGRERLAIEEFAKALEFIPITLAENAGMDSIDVLTELKTSHESGNSNHGLNLFSGKIEDTSKAGIIEPLKVKTQAIASASEVAIMILRIDDVIAARKPSERDIQIGNMEGYE
jgi:archaeal chaperonin